ncbi:HAD family phosphatase [Marinobacterium sp. D7]|nr:HAD family phosphatase [Marinobacterium ramblicola]
MPLRAILFDHDGTLVDSEATHMQLWREVVAPYGVQISDSDYWQRMLGVPMEQNATDIVQMYALEVDPEALIRAKIDANERFLTEHWFPQMPEASRILSHLSQRCRLALVSGSQRNCVDASLHGHGWHTLFEQVVTGDDVTRNKPHPDGYLKALQLMQLDPELCVAVEDTEVGVLAAHDAGLRVIAIRNPLASTHNFGPATVVVDSLIDAEAWITAQINN